MKSSVDAATAQTVEVLAKKLCCNGGPSSLELESSFLIQLQNKKFKCRFPLVPWLLLACFNSSELPANQLKSPWNYLSCVLEKVWSLVFQQLTATRGYVGKFWKFWPLAVVRKHHQEHILWWQKKDWLWRREIPPLVQLPCWIALVKAELARGSKAKLQFCRMHCGISQQAFAYKHMKSLFRELSCSTSYLVGI